MIFLVLFLVSIEKERERNKRTAEGKVYILLRDFDSIFLSFINGLHDPIRLNVAAAAAASGCRSFSPNGNLSIQFQHFSSFDFLTFFVCCFCCESLNISMQTFCSNCFLKAIGRRG